MQRVTVTRDDPTKNLLHNFHLLDADETLISSSVQKPWLRQEILDRLDAVAELYQKNGKRKSAKVMSELNWIFDTINKEFIPTTPPSQKEMLDEIRGCIFGTLKYDPITCYNATFAVHVARWGLKFYQLPMVQSSKWKEFAKNYCGLVIAA